MRDFRKRLTQRRGKKERREGGREGRSKRCNERCVSAIKDEGVEGKEWLVGAAWRVSNLTKLMVDFRY